MAERRRYRKLVQTFPVLVRGRALREALDDAARGMYALKRSRAGAAAPSGVPEGAPHDHPRERPKVR